MTYRPQRMRFGAFIAPFHALGEHHSGGSEIIGSPDLFIAGAAARTRRIRLGTGVVSLGYHHPFILADRMVQLDHQTRGRIMFGIGPGQLPADAFMMGIHPSNQREMMNQSLEALIDLFEGRSVTTDAGWFKLDNARLQLLPYQAPRMEMAIACSFTPNGAVLAGKHGLSMLSVAASMGPGFAALPDHWRICEEVAAENGRTVDRDSWRVVAPIHVAATREQARADVAEGVLPAIIDYLRATGGPPMQEMLSGVETPDQAVELWTTKGIGPFGVLTLGTPEDVAAGVENLLVRSGGYGRFLALAHNTASWAATRNSYEMFTRHVMPRFQSSDRRRESVDYLRANGDKFIPPMVDAIGASLEEHKNRMAPAK